MLIKYFLFWLPMIILAFANATLRELVFIKHFSESAAHQLSTLSLIIFCAIYTWFILPSLNIQNTVQAFLAGLIWVILTIAFEFALGRLTNKSWEFLLADYNLLAGRIWPIFLLVLFFLPFIVYSIRLRA